MSASNKTANPKGEQMPPDGSRTYLNSVQTLQMSNLITFIMSIPIHRTSAIKLTKTYSLIDILALLLNSIHYSLYLNSIYFNVSFELFRFTIFHPLIQVLYLWINTKDM